MNTLKNDLREALKVLDDPNGVTCQTPVAEDFNVMDDVQMRTSYCRNCKANDYQNSGRKTCVKCGNDK